MSCWRIDLRHNFAAYLHGELDTSTVRRIENHLLDCGLCRTRLAHLRNGHRLALEMPQLTPRRDPWTAIESAINDDRTSRNRPRVRGRWRGGLLKPGMALALIGVAALIAALLVASGRFTPGVDRSGYVVAEAFDFSEFQAVNISDIDQNRKPHVVAEGYVSETRVNGEEGDLSFKLVDQLGHPGPFIICEIVDPIKLALPSVGSRVRVYGVSRYDGQENHNWYEVHPVLNIEVVQR